jgi:peptide subunit release factor 1 (eRF1)
MLSLYLNVNQGQQANINRGFERSFKDMTASVREGIHDPVEMERFHHAEHKMAGFLAAYDPRGRTLVMFFDEAEDFFWHQELDIAMPNLIRWDRELCLKPLAAATEEFERYGVVLADRANARLFAVFLGTIEETTRESFDPLKVRHIRKVGDHHWGSASQAQSKADEEVRRNLRHVSSDVDSLVQSRHIDHLILAGAPEVVTELRNLLPKRLGLRVIGETYLDMRSSPQEVLEKTMALAERVERETEEQLVRELATSAAKTDRAVVGLSRTLKMVNQGRVWQLVYSDDFHAPGFECLSCSSLFSTEQKACSYCGASPVPVTDVVENAVQRALRRGARIEIVRAEAAAALDNAGGIGAFLKRRTKAVEG